MSSSSTPPPTPLDGSAPTSAVPPRLRPRRRWRLWLALGLPLIALTGSLAWFSLDESPPDLSGLLIADAPSASDDASYDTLAATVDQMKERIASALGDEATNAYFSGDFSLEKHFTVRSACADLWPAFETQMDALHGRPALPVTPDEIFKSAVGQLRTAWRLRIYEARYLAATGQIEPALQLAEHCARLSQLVCRSEGRVIDTITGHALRGISVDGVLAIASTSDVPPARLIELAHSLDALRPDATQTLALQRSTLHELRVRLRTLPAEVVAEMAPGNRRLGALLAQVHFHPNRTLRLATDDIRSGIALADRPYADVRRPWNVEVFPEPRRIGPLPLSRNYIGTTLLRASMTGPDFPSRMQSSQNTYLSLQQAYLALLAYQRDHAGAVPAMLGELVPAYLPAVSRDYILGTDLLWDPELQVVWSPGHDRRHTPAAATETYPGNIQSNGGAPEIRLPTAPRLPPPPADSDATTDEAAAALPTDEA